MPLQTVRQIIGGIIDVAGGRRDRKPWEEHGSFLAGLAGILAADRDQPTVLLGDFNQTIPRKRAPKAVFDQLVNLLSDGFNLATTGNRDAIDHLAFRANLLVKQVSPLDNTGPNGMRLSDHIGMVVRLVAG